jgi:hypothetical protein
MCCEVSYLYIGLLTELSYLTYMGFLNNQKLYISLFRSKPVYVRIFEGGCHGGGWWLRGRLKSGSLVEIEAQLCRRVKMALQNR